MKSGPGLRLCEVREDSDLVTDQAPQVSGLGRPPRQDPCKVPAGPRPQQEENMRGGKRLLKLLFLLVRVTCAIHIPKKL